MGRLTQHEATYGGQAVIEGVMIRGPRHVATACRVADDRIVVHQEPTRSLLTRYRWLNIPFIRGTPALIDALAIGFRSLIHSANLAVEAEGQKPPSPWYFTLSIAVAFVFGIGLFVLLPSAAIGRVTENSFLLNVLEGFARLAIFVAYIAVINRMREVRRLFQYHGAEHKVVNAYEAGRPLTDADGFSVIHRRCGTGFIFNVIIVGILVHAVMGWPSFAIRLASRLVVLPVIAGIAYELTRLAGRYGDSLIVRALIAPGMWLERLTTAEPTADQIEVAQRAMQAALDAERGVAAARIESEVPQGDESRAASELPADEDAVK
ncbi:MAG: DUF1385 domain-containing protein [Armatimonadota bacterium]|nr:MAG: DUF1385 domain-containing protein [Armatimonadota bacterium]